MSLIRRMSFRRRLTLAGAAAVAIAIALAATITYVVVREELRDQLDGELRTAAGQLTQDRVFLAAPGSVEASEVPAPGGERPFQVPVPPAVRERLVLPAPPLGDPRAYAQLVRADGGVVRPLGARVELPPGRQGIAVARSGEGDRFSEARVDGTKVRVLTRGLEKGTAVQVARPLADVESTLSRLRWVLAAVTLGGVGLAGGLGLLVTRTALRPVAELTETAEHVARTRDLSRRIDESAGDELGRLAGSFNTMLTELEASMLSQRRLVADASHELRTPLTSLRTNTEVLARADGMDPAERERLLADVIHQIEDLSGLVGDLLELARDEEIEEAAESVRLDELVADAVERARRVHPDRDFEVEAKPTVVEGVPGKIDRALSNMLDNAGKWSPEGGRVEVRVGEGMVTVRDHGPGIASEDLDRVFERFYRAPSARGTPGSGLGLAIVQAVAQAHGGRATAQNASDGGARVRLSLPVRRTS